MATIPIAEQKIDALPGGLTAAGVTSTSGGRQQYNGAGGTYFENPQNVGTPQYKNTYTFIPSGDTNIGTAANPMMVPTGSPAHLNWQQNIQGNTNPVISGTNTANDVSVIGKDITNLTDTSAASAKMIQDRMDALERRRDEEVANIKAEYEIAKGAQETRQGQDYAGRATGLTTSGGGFLGTTQSHQGVLQNMKATFETEKNALMAKRDAAVSQARNAYEDKQFALAKEKIAEAKSTEQEIYNRQKDHAAELLAVARENRSKQEFDMGIADKKVEAYSNMSDVEFAKVSPDEIAMIDKSYFPGFTVSSRDTAKKALNAKTQKEAVALDADILDMRLKIPQGQKFTLGGVTYTGLKKPESAGKLSDAEQFKSTTDFMKNNIFVKGSTIIGSQGVPFIEAATGKITPEGWREAQKISGMKRDDFISEFQGLLNLPYINNYDLTGGEIKKITGLDPVE
jgi:hypothetical protein